MEFGKVFGHLRVKTTSSTDAGSIWRNGDAIQYADSSGVAQTLQTLLSAITGTVTFNDRPLSRFSASIREEAGTSYTLQASDNGVIIEFTNNSDIELTIPPSLPAGFNCTIIQAGTGVITRVLGSGVTTRNPQGHTKTAGQYAWVTIAQSSTANAFYWVGVTAA